MRQGDDALKLSCVILTMGNRVAELNRAVESALNQADGDIEIVIVGNGADVPPITAEIPPGSKATIKTIRLPENVGIPEGRNRGVQECTGDVVLFLDDDGWYANSKVAAHIRERFADRARPRRDLAAGDGPRRRRRAAAARAAAARRRPGAVLEVTTFLGGASAVRRSAFLQVGGLPGEVLLRPRGDRPRLAAAR